MVVRRASNTAPHWKAHWIAWRNGVLANPRFQALAAATPGLRHVARSRARELFDRIAGFTYSQITLAAVESGLLDAVARGPASLEAISHATGLSHDAGARLVRASAALALVEEVSPGMWMLGAQGAVLHADPGLQAMIRHHRLLYADLADPVALLAADRGQATALSRFWSYVGGETPERLQAAPYSELMAATQAMVSREALAAYHFGGVGSVLDIGGGHGRFAMLLAARHPGMRIGVFDLPEVIADTESLLAEQRHERRIATHPGNFFHTPVPGGYDCHTLVRILHDHDDDRALELLRASRRALLPGGRLVVIEPMAASRGAEAMGAYFEMYLWAMGSGRPRSEDEIGAMLRSAGFSHWKRIRTRQPLITSLVVAFV